MLGRIPAIRWDDERVGRQHFIRVLDGRAKPSHGVEQVTNEKGPERPLFVQSNVPPLAGVPALPATTNIRGGRGDDERVGRQHFIRALDGGSSLGQGVEQVTNKKGAQRPLSVQSNVPP
jgi:hypothetical protein